MKVKNPIGMCIAIQLIPVLAQAQTEATKGGNSQLSSLFLSVLPFVLVAAAIFFMLRFAVSGKRAKTYDEHRERQMQHMERVEQTLERIARALEKTG